MTLSLGSIVCYFVLPFKDPSVHSIAKESRKNNEHSSQQNLLRNKELQQAFKKILDKKVTGQHESARIEEQIPKEEDWVLNKRIEDSLRESVLSSNEYGEIFKNKMNFKEKKETIEVLKAEINNDEIAVNLLKASGEIEAANTLEEKTHKKKQQLEYFLANLDDE